MKNKIIHILVLAFFVVTACQEEEREVIEPDDPVDSQLSVLMKNVATHDGSFDDIVDQGNCLSINIPYEIIRNGESYTVTHTSDYLGISATDNIEIEYPIIVTLFDYSEIAVSNEEELQTLTNACSVNDDDIECIDFEYPIVFSSFDSRTNRLETKQLIHDSEMFEFIANTDENTVFSIDYPINLLLHDGSSTSVQHNTDLRNAIIGMISACDENDS